MKRNVFSFFVFIIIINSGLSQDTIRIKNGSFEGVPQKGNLGDWLGIEGWTDCAPFQQFRNETPPDIHPNGFFGNSIEAKNGNTYLGMVTRDNGTYESVGQKLSEPLKKDSCYTFTVYLAKAENYFSPSRTTMNEVNYNKPVSLEIWGSSEICIEENILAVSKLIDHADWRKYLFTLKPKTDIYFIRLSAYYKRPTLIDYCGNLLIDDVHEIVSTPCYFEE